MLYAEDRSRSWQHSREAEAVKPVCVCRDLRALMKCTRDETAELVICHRPVTPDIRTAFEALDLNGFQDLLLAGTGSDILSGLVDGLDTFNWPQSVAALILQDVEGVNGLTSQWGSRYRLRLEHVTDDACRKFHKDRTDIRLITTYRGRGTQWIDAGRSNSEPPVEQLGPFDVGAFLGRRDCRGQRIYHRSPPMEASDLSRLVLVLDIERPGWSSRRSSRSGGDGRT